MDHARTILSVVGPHSGCGKTSFVIHLVRHIPGLGCLKISPGGDRLQQRPGRGKAIRPDYDLEDSQRLERSGTDTALYLTAGAAVVHRLRHRRDGLATGLHAALALYPESTPIVVESSRAVRLLHPAAVVLVVRPPIREMKPTTEAILPQVTDLLINSSDPSFALTASQCLQRDFPSLKPRFTWSADLIREPPPQRLLARLRTLLTPR
ncbi:MAG TPA: hypothetical protein VM243_20440 [Phycisphaerae bacterium]|nr:hypothetical protein [Phycisphaerae bacterium]